MAGLLAGLAQLVSIAAAFWLGGGLIWRGLRGRARPELLLGVHLLLTMGVGTIALSIVSFSSYRDTGMSSAAMTALAGSGNAVVIIGLMAALWFNREVFHAGQRVGVVLSWACSALMWGGLAFLGFTGGLADPNHFATRAYLPLCGAMVLADLWVAADALRFRAQLARRLALGLAEPIVVERLALWGYGAMARIGLVVMAPIVNTLALSPEQRMEIAPAVLMLSAFLILTTCVAYWLMLAPTEGYRRWVERRYAASARADGKHVPAR
jgi:hypothetical protein